MKFTTVLTCLIVLALATVALAQEKISGTLQCDKADPQHSIPVGDRPNHTFTLNQNKCTWTKPMEIAGTQTKEDVTTGFADISGEKSSDRGYALMTMASGDKARVSWQGSGTVKDGQLQSGEGKFSFLSGSRPTMQFVFAPDTVNQPRPGCPRRSIIAGSETERILQCKAPLNLAVRRETEKLTGADFKTVDAIGGGDNKPEGSDIGTVFL